MIEPSKQRPALEIIQWLMILGRQMAYCREPHERVAELLDWGEYLPGLMLRPDDQTAEFRATVAMLADAAREHPVGQLQGLLAKFDAA